MKKLIAILLMLTLCVSLFVACGDSGTDTQNSSKSPENIGITDADTDTEDAENSGEQEIEAFQGKECTWTYNDVKLKLTYNEDIIDVKKAADGFSLRVGLDGKMYSETFDLAKHTPQSYYESKKSDIEAKEATPNTYELTDTGDGKSESTKETKYKVTETYGDLTMSDLEPVAVKSGMTVYRFETKYSVTETRENLTDPGEAFTPIVTNVDNYQYFIDLGNGYVYYAFAFSADRQTVDKEDYKQALETLLNDMYVEIVTE